MMINRYNYEEYFLLYVDMELSSADSEAVELFVQQNPDLATELRILQQTKLPGEEVTVFENKQLLYKKESGGINMHNYEEYFLLYIDKELKDAEKKAVEKFVLQHPQLQEEFTLLNHAVLEPEIITFRDKSSLYHKEERRIIPVAWMRIAIAAVFIGLAVMIWWLVPSAENTRIATIKSHNQKEQTADQNTGGNIVRHTPIQPQADDVAATVPLEANNLKNNAEELLNSKRKNQKENQVEKINQANKSGELAGNQLNNAPAIKNNQINNLNNNASHQNTDVAVIKIDPPVDGPVSTPADIEPSSDIIAFENTNNISSSYHTNNTTFQPVVYKELDTNDDDRSINVGSMQLNKDKLKGFFKKAGRIFGGKGKNNASDDGKLQIANLEIKTN